jgi:putative transposase
VLAWATAAIWNVRIARELLEKARDTGVSLTGPGGLLRQITKTVLEAALNAELDDHLGYEKGDRGSKNTTNERNGTSSKTVTTDIGDVRISAPRDREGTFTPQIVPKHARRIEGFDETVISLYGKGLTTGEIQNICMTFMTRRCPGTLFPRSPTRC